MAIVTDGKGRPFERPEPPPKDAGIEVKIAFIRAMHEYNDRVTDRANKAFAAEFRRKIRVGKGDT